MSSDSQTSYQVKWYNAEACTTCPYITIQDFGGVLPSKVMYMNNSQANNLELLTKTMKVYINEGQKTCESTATNFQYYSWPAEAGLTAICTHKSEFSSNNSVVDRCSALTS